LAAGCSTLYSEDMHDGMRIGKTLTIRNPFR
jgi:predicted nucleic acid-binding protein